MERLYVNKISNKEGKELFKGERVLKVLFNNKEYNLYGDIDIIREADCYNTNGRYLGYIVNIGKEEVVTENTKKGFIVIK
ncbi:MAG: hypothetical protein ACI3T9_00885 [Romboutsia timonensis]